MKRLSNRQLFLETREREPKEEEIHIKEGLKARQKKKHGPKEAEKIISVTVYVYSKFRTARRRLEEVSKWAWR